MNSISIPAPYRSIVLSSRLFCIEIQICISELVIVERNFIHLSPALQRTQWLRGIHINSWRLTLLLIRKLLQICLSVMSTVRWLVSSIKWGRTTPWFYLTICLILYQWRVLIRHQIWYRLLLSSTTCLLILLPSLKIECLLLILKRLRIFVYNSRVSTCKRVVIVHVGKT